MKNKIALDDKWIWVANHGLPPDFEWRTEKFKCYMLKRPNFHDAMYKPSNLNKVGIYGLMGGGFVGFYLCTNKEWRRLNDFEKKEFLKKLNS